MMKQPYPLFGCLVSLPVLGDAFEFLREKKLMEDMLTVAFLEVAQDEVPKSSVRNLSWLAKSITSLWQFPGKHF